MSGTGGRDQEDTKGDGGPAPRPHRARGKPARKAPTAAELRAALADRERQLRDLTEQSLDLLDRLTEAQRREVEHVAVAEHAERLTRDLEDARRRLRTAGGVVLRDGSDPAATPAVDVVLWGGDEASVRARVDALAPETSITWVGPTLGVPAFAGAADRVRWLAAGDARTPAQCWNLAMAATEAEVVFFLGPAALLSGEPTPASVATDRSVALAQPTCARGDRLQRGRRATPDLSVFEAVEASPQEPATDVEFADPAAFLVRREAFAHVGMFDEALLGDLALADFALRARARGFRVLGVAAPQITVTASHPDDHAARDRLLLLATHRRDRLGAALAQAPTLWDLAPDAAAAFVVNLFERLPAGAASANATATILGSLVAHAAPAARVVAALHALLDTQLAIWTEPPLPDATAELTSLNAQVDGADAGSVRDALACLEAVLAFERRWMPRLAEVQAETARRHADAVRRTEELAREVDATRRALQLHQEGLQVVAHAIDMVGHPEPARIRERLLDLRRDAEHLASLLAAAGAPSPTALIGELYEVRTQLAVGREAIAARDAELAGLRREITERDRELAERDHELGERHAALTERDRMIGERDRRLSSAEARVEELTKQLTARIAELRSLETLASERGRWIAGLLAEVGKRRLRPRKLLDHERAFLAQQGGTQQARTP